MPIFAAISKIKHLERPVWYGISNRRLFPGLAPETYLKLLFETSASMIQWREKDLSLERNRVYVETGVRYAQKNEKVFLVNSSSELAVQTGADGVHLTSRQSVSGFRRQLASPVGPEFWVGKSVHSVAEALRAADEGVDYLLLGPVFSPLSKASRIRPLGLEQLAQAVREVDCPIFALGGINSSNSRAVLDVGVAGIAGITWIAQEIQKSLGETFV